MAINVGNAVFRRREHRIVHFDPEEYSDGDEIFVSFRQQSGPERLVVALQMAEGKRSMPALDEGWTTILEVSNYADSDVSNDGSVVLELRERYKRGGGGRLRALVVARPQSLEERSYRLTVSSGK